MPGKPLENSTKTQQQEITDRKKAFLSYFGAWPVKKAAAEAVNRSVDTIDIWLKNDPDFSEKYFSARAEWAKRKSGRLSPDNLLANMYPEELKPPKQEVASTITVTSEQSATDLLEEARRLGLDTSAYDHLIQRSTGDAEATDRTQEGA